MPNIIKRSAIVTIVSNNYLHFARTMLQSANRHHGEYDLYCVIVDRDLSYAAELSAEFHAIPIDRLRLPLGEEFFFQYNILELNTAVKPWAIEYLFDTGYDGVIYVDPDIYLYGRMCDVEELLSATADIVLTPHLLSPVTDEKRPKELDIRRAGTYNLGFCALRESVNSRHFLRWWQSKLVRDCVNDADRGLFVDQSWIDLVPGLFDRVAILRHTGYNVAYWNIAQREITKHATGTYFSGENPLIFFHFSGLEPSNPDVFSKHQDRFTLSNIGVAKELVEHYARTVVANNSRHYQTLAYSFGRFTNGDSVLDIFRKLYRQSHVLRTRMGANPFDRAESLCDPWDEISIEGVSPTTAMVALWNEHRGAQSQFPLDSAKSIEEYYQWFVNDPWALTYFSDGVISFHRLAVSRIVAKRKSDSDKLLAIQKKNKLGNERCAYHLYSHLLGRAPDADGLRHYSELCATDSGFIRAWGEIGLSEESKKKSFVWFRMLKALIFSKTKMEKGVIGLVDTNQQPEGRNIHPLTGVFPAEADVSDNGIWVTRRVTTSVTVNSGDKICLRGVYFSELIASHAGSVDSKIGLYLDGKEIYSTQLVTSGDFIIECRVPNMHWPQVASFVIESDKFFVPKNIGNNNDERELAWRMKALNVGEQEIFDCAKQNAIVSPENGSLNAQSDIEDPRATSFELAYQGFTHVEPDSDEFGVWVPADVVLPILPIAGERICVRGAYFPELIFKQTGGGTSTLRFWVQGNEIHSMQLTEPGEFVASFLIPEMKNGEGGRLRIHCNNAFVPKDLGLGDDIRALSWRMRSVKSGDVSVFDCTRENVATSNRRFVPRMRHRPNFEGLNTRVFAFYRPQFQIPPTSYLSENRKNVSWADIANAAPQYPDHHQPHLPVELGFYDHREPTVLARQVALAKQYGLAGFCFYHYRVAGQVTCDQPLTIFLSNPSLDSAFCACWVYEEWPQKTASEVEWQRHAPSVIDDLVKAFRDPRYCRVDLKPVLIIENAGEMPNIQETIACWRTRSIELGLCGLFLVAVLSDKMRRPCRHGFDAGLDRPPEKHDVLSNSVSIDIERMNMCFSGQILDYGSLPNHQRTDNLGDTMRFEAVVTSWDDEAQNPGAGTSFAKASPEKYAKWLAAAIERAARNRPDARLLFINSWNSWGEGAHLEADQRDGYGYLHATAAVLTNRAGPKNVTTVSSINQSFIKKYETVLIAHIYYEDLIDTIFDSYLYRLNTKCDLIATVRYDISEGALKKIKEKFANCFIIQVLDCGRDVRPFVIAYREAHKLGYLYACKWHTKKSLQRPDGSEWRNQLLSSLFPSLDGTEEIITRLREDAKLGLLVPKGSLHDVSAVGMPTHNAKWLDILVSRIDRKEIVEKNNFQFPAGSMFWFRMTALSLLREQNVINPDEFEFEAGQLDGTLAHALERFVGILPSCEGLRIEELG